MSQDKKRIPIPKPESGCFACGRENLSGLQMQFQSDGIKLYSSLTPALHFRGWHNLLHGGIVSTILDEIMAWAAIHFLERFPLTKTIQVDFLRPVYVQNELTATGWPVDRPGKREAVMAGRIEDGAGRSLAEGQARMVLAEPESRLFRKIVP
ncbi:MAG: PaaI family thioesterase, partial [Desulfohalobiaceae bacterium]|nr:PaaI family thioesterase [Desulfohalobiaceae bacterium]